MPAKKRRGALPRIGSGLDLRSLGEGVRFPGIDPRQWISYGVVEAQTKDDDDPEVTFDDELGPQVKVILEPSKTPVVCRVATVCAGNGEGAFSPFVKGDEVLVAIPEGDENAGCVIIGRLNNAIDKFPMDSVAGQDPTTNTFGFERRRTPYVIEVAGPYTIRSAKTGALIGIDSKGAVTLLNGDSSGFQIGSDLIGVSTKDGSALLQLNFTDKCISIRLDDAVLNLTASGGSANNTISVPDALNIITSGNAATEHAVTTEAVAGILLQMLLVVGPLLTTPITPANVPAAVAAWFTAAAATPLVPVVSAAIAGAFAAMPPKLSSFPQTLPGIGCPGLIIG